MEKAVIFCDRARFAVNALDGTVYYFNLDTKYLDTFESRLSSSERFQSN